MKLYIDEKYPENFACEVVPKIMFNLFINSCNKQRLTQLSKALDINCSDVIKLAINTLIKSKTNGCYTLSISKLKLDDRTLDDLVHIITYGDRTIQGYPILLDIFEYITENIDRLYERWLNGDTILW